MGWAKVAETKSLLLPSSATRQGPHCDTMGDTLNASADGYEIYINNLTYTHRKGASPSLSDVNIRLPKGSRTILVGANGGKQLFRQYINVLQCSLFVDVFSTLPDMQPGNPRSFRFWRGSASYRLRGRSSISRVEMCFVRPRTVSLFWEQSGALVFLSIALLPPSMRSASVFAVPDAMMTTGR